MKILLFLLSSCCFSGVISDSLKAYGSTEEGKTVKQNITRLSRYIPKELSILAGIGISKNIDYKIDNNSKFNYNIKKETITYKVNWNF